jgi:enamine deaminase RidA (YjgF/YER057c/UK114 family)
VDRAVSGPHELINPDSLAPPLGFSHAVVARPGRTVFVGGQTAHGPDGAVRGGSQTEQVDAALGNLVEALAAAGALPEHLVSMQIFVSDAAEYRANLGPIGDSWRRHFGKHYPALALFEVSGFLDPEVAVELVAIAVVPEDAIETPPAR